MLSNIHSLPVVSEKGENLIDGKINFQFDLIKNFIIIGTLLHTQHLIKKKLKLHNYGTKIKYEDECFGVSLAWTRQFTHNPEDPTSNNFIFYLA